MTGDQLPRILYAEDEPDIRTIAQVALEEIGGFTVKYCASGKELLEVIEDFQPDLLLLDVMMPEMDGLTTLLELRRNPKFSRTPVIFMTAKIQPGELEEYKKLGVLDVISKPFDPMALSDKIKQAWIKHHE